LKCKTGANPITATSRTFRRRKANRKNETAGKKRICRSASILPALKRQSANKVLNLIKHFVRAVERFAVRMPALPAECRFYL